MLGDQPILRRLGGPVTLGRLRMIYGEENAWDPQTFGQKFTFVGNPEDLKVVRRSDSREGRISAYRDSADKAHLYYNFRAF